MKIKFIATLFLTLGICGSMANAKGEGHPKHRRDTDGNGTLSLAEFTADRKNPDRAKARFEAADTNKDGQLDKSERAALRKHRRAAAAKHRQNQRRMNHRKHAHNG